MKENELEEEWFEKMTDKKTCQEKFQGKNRNKFEEQTED